MKVTADNPKFNGKVPHLLLKAGDISEIVLLPGDPARVEKFRDLLENFRIISNNREYVVARGSYNNVDITICSTGIGAPSTEIAVIELIEIGAKALIRIGGSGVLKEEINCGEMVITTGAIRDGGASKFYAPDNFPAVASFEVIDSLIKACENNNTVYHKGISASVGSFFAGQGRAALNKKFHEENLIEKYRNLNVLNIEMESETILTLSSLFNVYSGCICAVHANRITNEWLYDFEEAQLNMCKIALNACEILKNKYL